MEETQRETTRAEEDAVLSNGGSGGRGIDWRMAAAILGTREGAADAGRERHGATDGAGDGREDWQNRAPSCGRLH
jgi:hypothetical protein